MKRVEPDCGNGVIFDLLGLTPAEAKEHLPVAWAALQLRIRIGPDGLALCPFHHDTEPSFHVWQGRYSQRWGCWPCGDSGDVLDLIRRMTGCTFPEAMERAQQMIGEMPEGWTAPPMADRSEPEEGADFSLEVIAGWERAAARPAWPEVLREWGVGLGPSGEMLLPHWEPDGQTVTGVKVRGADSKWSLRGSTYPHLYGCWQPQTSPHVILCEGETDTLVAAERVRKEALLLDVLALPHGVCPPRPAWVEFLARWSHVYVALDNDTASIPHALRWDEALDRRSSNVSLPPGADLRDTLGSGISLTQLLDLPASA